MEQHISTIGIHLGESDFCLSVYVGNCPIYLHGTTADIRAFAEEILARADERDVQDGRQKEEPCPASGMRDETDRRDHAQELAWANDDCGLVSKYGYRISIGTVILPDGRHGPPVCLLHAPDGTIECVRDTIAQAKRAAQDAHKHQEEYGGEPCPACGMRNGQCPVCAPVPIPEEVL